MASPSVLVTDTNIWIDLENGGILAAFLLGRSLGATLLIGNWRLGDLAARNGIPVHDVLWLLDEMVRFKTVAPRQAAAALNQMLDRGARLPHDECQKRLTSWFNDRSSI